MALSFIAVVHNSNDVNGTTLDATASLNVAAGDLLVAWCKHEGGDTTIAVAKNSGSPANAFTFDAGDKLTATGITSAWGYLLSASVDATTTFRMTQGASRGFRRFFVLQFRPDTSETVSKDTSAIASGNGTAINSGNISTTGTDEVVCGGYGDGTNNTTTSELIDGVGATEPTGSPDNFTSVWYRILTATFTGGAASATITSAQWNCGVIAFKSVAAGSPQAPRSAHQFRQRRVA